MNDRFNKLNHCLQGRSAVLSGINLLPLAAVYYLRHSGKLNLIRVSTFTAVVIEEIINYL